MKNEKSRKNEFSFFFDKFSKIKKILKDSKSFFEKKIRKNIFQKKIRKQNFSNFQYFFDRIEVLESLSPLVSTKMKVLLDLRKPFFFTSICPNSQILTTYSGRSSHVTKSTMWVWCHAGERAKSRFRNLLVTLGYELDDK